MNYVQLAIPYFLLAIMLESSYGYLRKNQTYRLNDTVNSLQMGMLSGLVGVLRLGFSAIVFTQLVALFGVQQWSADSWVHWVLAFVAYDCCYYCSYYFYIVLLLLLRLLPLLLLPLLLRRLLL